MAEPMNAVKAYVPMIKQEKTVKMAELIKYLAGRTNMNEGAVQFMLMELRDAILFFNRSGRPVKLGGVGTFRPSIQLNGTVNVTYRADNFLKNRLNDSDGFEGEILNKEMLGVTMDELIARWNEEHPGDPVEEPKTKDKGKK